jgi:hypothetical protein
MQLGTAGTLGIGANAAVDRTLFISTNITGAATSYALQANGQIQSSVNTTAYYISTQSNVNAATTVQYLTHFSAYQGTVSGTIAQSQVGFYVDALTSGTNFNIGLQSTIAVNGSKNWNLYLNGSAPNYMAGSLGVGTTTVGATAGSINAVGAITFQTTTNNQSYTTTGAGTITISSGTAGSIDNMNIGATTRGTGAFTTLGANGAVTIQTTTNNQSYTTTGAGTITVSSGTLGTIDNMTVGGTTRAAGSFTFVGAGKASSTAAFVNTAAGTTAIAPIQLTSGTNLTTAAAGAIEYDGSVQYFSPAASTRSTVAAEQVVVLNTAYTLTSATGVQKLFNNTTNGAVTLPVGTYQFECYVTLSTLAATGTFGFALAGGATYTQYWQATGARVAAGTAATASTSFNTTANAAITPTSATTTAYMWIRGVLNVTVTGTVIPQFSQTVASAAVVGVGSFFKVSPFSGTNSTTNVTVGNWS